MKSEIEVNNEKNAEKELLITNKTETEEKKSNNFLKKFSL
jgi:hypothetical protein